MTILILMVVGYYIMSLSMINQLCEFAQKSNINIKLAAGIFYSKKGFLSIGYNSNRTYVNNTIKSTIHAEDDVIRQCKKRYRVKKTSHLKLIVIRLSPGNKLLNSKPCVNCTKAIREFGIKKVYYYNDKNELESENIDKIHKFHQTFPYVTATNLWFYKVQPTMFNPMMGIIASLQQDNKKYTTFTPEMGHAIRTVRLLKQLTQEELASSLSLNVNVIKKIEEGRYPYNSNMVLLLRRKLGYFSW